MIEKSLYAIEEEFLNFVGFKAKAEISDKGALRSAGVIIELFEKVSEKTTQPSDLFRATIATSQLIERWSQQVDSFLSGAIPTVDNVEALLVLSEMFSSGDYPEEEMLRILKHACVASPKLGAQKAMAVLSDLRTIYSDISLQQPRE